MEAVPRLPMLHFPRKENTDTSSFSGLKQYIAECYGENPDSYSKEIYELETLRNRAARPTEDMDGIRVVKRYICQINSIGNRFPLGDENAVLNFSWREVHSPTVWQSSNIGYEVAVMLFNLAGLHTQLGAMEDRADAEGMKVACTHFQNAGWIYGHIRDTYPVQMRHEMSGELLVLLQNIADAQAQECILEKGLADNRMPVIVAKITAQIVSFYNSAMAVLLSTVDGESISDVVGSKLFKAWKRYVKFKISYFSAILYLYQGMQSEEAKKWGERVTYFNAATEKIEEAKKETKGMDDIEAINEAMVFTMDVIEAKRKISKNENDFIYHEEEPELKNLSAVQGANLVKCAGFSFEDPEIMGADIFHRLVPMKAHENCSIYSEEKANLVRMIGARIEEKDIDLETFMSSLDLTHMNLNLVVLQDEKLPQTLVDRCAALSARPNTVQELVSSMASLSEVSVEVEGMLSDIRVMLAEEERQEELFQKSVGQRPPNGHLTELKREFQKYLEYHTKAGESNDTLRKAMGLQIEKLKTLALPLREIQQAIPRLNAPLDQSALKDLDMLQNKVEEMRNQRHQLLATLREALNNDDITSQVISWGDKKIEKLFKKELAKHEKIIQVIEQNLAAQDNILKALTETYAKRAPLIKEMNETKVKREQFFKGLIASYDFYEDIHAKSTEGIEFYKKLQKDVQKLLSRVKAARDVQDEERTQRMKPPPSKQQTVVPPSTTTRSGGPKLKDYLNSGFSVKDHPRPSPLGSESVVDPRCAPTAPMDAKGVPFQNYGNQQVPQYDQQGNPIGYVNPIYQYGGQQNYAKDYAKTNQHPANYQQPKAVPNPPSTYNQVGPYGYTFGGYNQEPGNSTPSTPYPAPNQSKNTNQYANPDKMYPNQGSGSSPYYSNPSNSNPANPGPFSGYSAAPAPAAPTSQQSSYPQNRQPIYGQQYSPSPAPQVSQPSASPYTLETQYQNYCVPPSQTPNQYAASSQPSQYGQVAPSPSTNQYGQQTPSTPQPQYQHVTPSPSQYGQQGAAPSPSQPQQHQQMAHSPSPYGQQGTQYGQQVTPSSSQHQQATPSPSYGSSQMSSQPQPTSSYNPSPQPSNVQPPPPAAITSESITSHPTNPMYMGIEGVLKDLPASQAHLVSSTQTPTAVAAAAAPSTATDADKHNNSGHHPGYGYNMQTGNYDYGSGFQSDPYGAYNYQYSNVSDKSSSTTESTNFGVGGQSFAKQYGTPQQQQQQQPQQPVQPSNPTASGQSNGPSTTVTSSGTSAPVSSSRAAAADQQATTPKKPKSANIDLLSDIDFSSAPVSTLALQPLPLTPKKNDDTQSRISVASVNPPDLSPMKHFELPPDERKASVDDLSVCSDVSSIDPNFEWESASVKNDDVVKDVVETAKDPFEDPKMLKWFHKEVERLEKFIETATVKTLNGTTPLDGKWKELQDLLVKDESKRVVNVAKLFPEKNRSTDSLPYDHARVSLGTSTDDYINAGFVKFEKDKNVNLGAAAPTFILAQTPLTNTTNDFWSMIWTQQANAVVCLHPPTEILDTYWPQEINSSVTYDDFEITLLKQFDLSHCIERNVKVTMVGADKIHYVSLIQVKSWIKNSPNHVVSIGQNIITSYRQQNQGQTKHPLIIHCLNGADRSGLVTVAIASILATQTKRPILINVVDVWYRICSQRKGALRDINALQLSLQIILSHGHSILNKRGIMTSYQMKNVQQQAAIEKEETALNDPFKDLDPLWKLKG